MTADTAHTTHLPDTLDTLDTLDLDADLHQQLRAALRQQEDLFGPLIYAGLVLQRKQAKHATRRRTLAQWFGRPIRAIESWATYRRLATLGQAAVVAVLLLVATTTLSACNRPSTANGTVEGCATKIAENLNQGIVIVGYPQPQCEGLSPEQLDLVDAKVATTR